MADEKGLLKGKTVAVGATTLEANAAMKSIVRRDTGEDWNAYIQRLMQEAGEIEAGDCMDYAHFRKHGWPIGSGPVEAACKSVVKTRLCRSGMR